MKNKILLLITTALCAALVGCAQQAAESGNTLDNENQSEIQEQSETELISNSEKKAILVVSFGTTYNDSREATIGAIENKIKENYSDFEVRRAFTSNMVIKKLAERDGIEIDTVEQALTKLKYEGFGTVVVQPTHIMNGFEYDEMKEMAQPFENSFDSFRYGTPLLSSPDDYTDVAEAILAEVPEKDAESTAVVFMGHGSEHFANSAYAALNYKLNDLGYNNIFVGTVESYPDIEKILRDVKKSSCKNVVLYPFMIVAGDHANNDMAGDEPDSWKSRFEAEGYNVTTILKGLGEYDGIRELFVKHIEAAISDSED